MKKPHLLPILSIIIAVSFSSCRDDEKTELSPTDAAELAANNIIDNSDAIESNIEAGIQRLKSDSACGGSINFNRDLSFNQSPRSYTYQSSGIRTRICKNDSLVAFDFESTFNTTYNGPRWNSTGNGNRTGRLSEINSETDSYLWTGRSNKSTNGVYSGRREQNLNVSLAFQSEISINKMTERINGGYTNFTINGSGDEVENFNFNGQIKYLGNREVEITINGEVFLRSY